jgi:hypothetical protein
MVKGMVDLKSYKRLSRALLLFGSLLGASIVSAQDWTPSEIFTELWLDAADSSTLFEDFGTDLAEDGDDIAQWNDKSGSGNHSTQNSEGIRPTTGTRTIGGINTIDFGGVDAGDFMSLNDEINFVDKTIIAVAQQDDRDANHLFGGQSAIKQIRLQRRLVIAAEGNNWLGDITGGAVSNVQVDLSPHIVTFGGGNPGGFFLDGTLDINTYERSTDSVYGLGQIGAWQGETQSTERFNGVIGEALILPIPDMRIRQKIEGYLAHKWGLETNLPSDHPYLLSAPLTSDAAVTNINAAAVANDASGITLADIASVDGLSFTPVATNLTAYQTIIAAASGFADAAAIDAAFRQPMLITVNTALGLTVDISLFNTVSGVTIDWGDGTTPTTDINAAGTQSYTYSSEGDYVIEIEGTFTGYGWQNSVPATANVSAITGVTQWNLVGAVPTLTSLWGAFRGHINLLVVPDTLPSTVTWLRSIFHDTPKFNQDLSSWDTSGVSGANSMQTMFADARLSVDNYDRLITAWDSTTGVTLSNKDFDGGYSVFCEATDPLVNDGGPNCAPQIVRITLADDVSTVTVNWSKSVFTNSDGTGALTVNDYVLSLTAGASSSGATLNSTTPTSISQNGNSYILGLGLTGTLQPDQVISVLPAP